MKAINNARRLSCTRRELMTAAACLALAPLAGCGSKQAEQNVSPYGLSGVVTLGEYMARRYGSYETFDQGIQDGSNVPQTLSLYADGATQGFVHDEATITEYWNALSAVRINVDQPVDTPSDDGYLSFSFDSGKELIVFAFSAADLASFSDVLFPVEDPATVQELANALSGLVEKPHSEVGEELHYEDGSYWWDADGDGTDERVSFDFVDNGDEAPSVTELYVYGETVDALAYLNRAYEITSVKGLVDDDGPYLVIAYEAGDFYRHDFPAQCMVRLVDGELVVTELDS